MISNQNINYISRVYSSPGDIGEKLDYLYNRFQMELQKGYIQVKEWREVMRYITIEYCKNKEMKSKERIYDDIFSELFNS